ncbi:hypothetical protein [Xanthomonas campestris]|uniref:hypothetical protein n=1 Tax=Xanthomonas campestris TaxID=339 RepID=UPI0023781D1D|nr:hypothetical protein [Xanthomonas campestris]MEA9722333.1 hypothetical protein [Xanthomonas campestris]MEA9865290.1 hypothetical protein [Xanthomonas campestris pv. raphani]
MAVLVVVAVGLIEWNARRQAAAMTAELMRPMTPSEQRQLNRQLAQMDAEAAQEIAAMRRQLWQDQPVAPRYEPGPLRGSADIRVKMTHKLGFHPLHQ